MAPVRRYLRITKYSVLEVRIYMENPSHQDSWLLRRTDPALPRIIEAVRPLVLPKLREENERTGKRGGGAKSKAKGIKDTVERDDFEVSIFLTDLSTRHTVLTKHKSFETPKPRIGSNSGKLTGWLTTGTSNKPQEISDDDEGEGVRLREEDEEPINLDDIPEQPAENGGEGGATGVGIRPRKRRRQPSEEEGLFVDDGSDDDSEFAFQTQRPSVTKEQTTISIDADAAEPAQDDPATEEKKKLALHTRYDGFSIYGRILCLVVKRRGAGADGGRSAAAAAGKSSSEKAAPAASGQQMLEQWVSTQAAQQGLAGDDDDAEDG